MARSASTDPYLNFRFHLVDPAGGNLDPIAGFTQITTPEITVEPAEYREGIYRHTRKFPGVNTVGEVTCMVGTVKRESAFYDWIMRVINGGVEEYRSDLLILEFHITDEFGINGAPSRVMRIKECFPTTVKPMADKDATGSEVALQELTLTIEEIEVELVTSS